MYGSTRNYTRLISFNRPADATQYAVGDGVSDNTTSATSASFAFNGVASGQGCGGKIKSVVLYKSDQDQTGADFDICFFDTQPANTGYEDNAAIAITDAEWKRCFGFVRLAASLDAANVVTGDLYCKTNLDLPYQCLVNSTSIYAVIVARGTYTPLSGETFTVTIGGEVG